MRATAVRILKVLAVLASLPLLASCDIDAHVVVRGDDAVALDVTYWGVFRLTDENGADVTVSFDPCGQELAASTGLTNETLRDPADPHHLGCHIAGQSTLAVLRRVISGSGWLLHEGGVYHAFVPAELIRWSGLDFAGLGQPVTDQGTFRAEVTFPGPVIAQDASARVEGNTVI